MQAADAAVVDAGGAAVVAVFERVQDELGRLVAEVRGLHARLERLETSTDERFADRAFLDAMRRRGVQGTSLVISTLTAEFSPATDWPFEQLEAEGMHCFVNADAPGAPIPPAPLGTHLRAVRAYSFSFARDGNVMFATSVGGRPPATPEGMRPRAPGEMTRALRF